MELSTDGKFITTTNACHIERSRDTTSITDMIIKLLDYARSDKRSFA